MTTGPWTGNYRFRGLLLLLFYEIFNGAAEHL